MRGIRRRPIFVAALSLSLLCFNTIAAPVVSAIVPTASDGGKLKGISASSYDPDHVLLRLKPGADDAAVNKLLDKHDMVATDHLDAANIDVYDVGTNETPVSVAAKLAKDPNVALAEPDYIIKPTSITNDTNVDQLWGLDNFGQTVQGSPGISGVDTDTPPAWGTSTGQGVVVAVLDEGIDINHPELASHIWTGPDCFNDGIDHDNDGYINDCHGWDFYHGDKSVYDTNDGDDHGTHVAGTIAATANNSAGVAGIAPGATIMPLKFLGPNGGLTSDAITAIQFAKDHGAKIVNCSWGGSGFSQSLKDAMANSGMLFTVAAGNSGVNIATSPQYPASFDLPNEIVVAAVDNRGALASFSNRNGATSVGAPGVGILSTLPKRGAVTVGVDRSTSAYKSAFWGFGLEAVVGLNSRRDVLQAEMTRMGASSLSSPITIVDDDESSSGAPGTPDTSVYYTTALTNAGYTQVQVITVPKDSSGPSASALIGQTVIWETGYAVGSQTVNTLTATDLTQLTTFLSNGGKLLVAGADAIWRNELSSFVQNYLGIDYVTEGDARTDAVGVTGGVFAGMSINLAGTDSPKGTANQFQDVIDPGDSNSHEAIELRAETNYSDAYGYKNGTSMAAPHAAGVAALVAQVLPNSDPQTWKSIIESTVKPLASLAGTTRTGGMVDAAAAVAQAAIIAVPPADGYRFVASDGGIFSFGNAQFHGSAGGSKLNSPIVSMATTPDRNGYWLVAADGGIFAYNAPFEGSAGGSKLNRPIVGIAGTASGNGYWLVASDGGIFAFGDAGFYGSTGGIKLNQPIVGMTATPSGNGYWLVASDGGIFAFGDAGFYGSTGGLKLNKPIVGIAPTADGDGYWLVASDGGIFAFGDAGFDGSTGGIKLNKPIVGIAPTADSGGYWLAASDGGVFAFGNAGFYGSTGSIKLNQPIVSVTH